MTIATIFRDRSGACCGFRMLGHAGYADAGEDIVCSAVSLLTINTCNSLEQLCKASFDLKSDEEEGLIELRLKDDPTHDTELLLSSMILGLKSLAEGYGEFIQVLFEEV